MQTLSEPVREDTLSAAGHFQLDSVRVCTLLLGDEKKRWMEKAELSSRLFLVARVR